MNPAAIWIAIGWFTAQLLLNVIWTWLFFRWQLGWVAVIDIVLLWLAVGVTFVAFYRLRKIAAFLLIPYWLWISFATILTIVIWRSNPELL